MFELSFGAEDRSLCEFAADGGTKRWKRGDYHYHRGRNIKERKEDGTNHAERANEVQVWLEKAS